MPNKILCTQSFTTLANGVTYLLIFCKDLAWFSSHYPPQFLPLHAGVGISGAELLNICLSWRKRARVFKDVGDGTQAISPMVFLMVLSKNKATEGKMAYSRNPRWCPCASSHAGKGA
jgi:hypothetical protein